MAEKKQKIGRKLARAAGCFFSFKKSEKVGAAHQ